MKRITFLTLLIFWVFTIFSQNLVKIPVSNVEQTRRLLYGNNMKVHYYDDAYVIATAKYSHPDQVILDETPWEKGEYYFSLKLPEHEKNKEYLQEVQKISTVTSIGNSLYFLKVHSENVSELNPPADGWIMAVQNITAHWPDRPVFPMSAGKLQDPLIEAMVAAVDTVELVNNIQHLEDYGDRKSTRLNSSHYS